MLQVQQINITIRFIRQGSQDLVAPDLDLQVFLTDNVAQLLQLIHLNRGIEARNIRLIWAGRIIRPTQMIGDLTRLNSVFTAVVRRQVSFAPQPSIPVVRGQQGRQRGQQIQIKIRFVRPPFMTKLIAPDLNLQVYLADNVAKLFHLIHANRGINIAHIQLIYAGRYLRSDQIIGSITRSDSVFYARLPRQVQIAPEPSIPVVRGQQGRPKGGQDSIIKVDGRQSRQGGRQGGRQGCRQGGRQGGQDSLIRVGRGQSRQRGQQVNITIRFLSPVAPDLILQVLLTDNVAHLIQLIQANRGIEVAHHILLMYNQQILLANQIIGDITRTDCVFFAGVIQPMIPARARSSVPAPAPALAPPPPAAPPARIIIGPPRFLGGGGGVAVAAGGIGVRGGVLNADFVRSLEFDELSNTRNFSLDITNIVPTGSVDPAFNQVRLEELPSVRATVIGVMSDDVIQVALSSPIRLAISAENNPLFRSAFLHRNGRIAYSPIFIGGGYWKAYTRP